MTLAAEKQQAQYFLERIAAPITTPMVEAVVAWKRAESGNHVQRNNPLNIRFFQGEPGYSHMDGGFSVFTSLENGWRAVQFGLEKWPKGNFRKYAEIIQAARTGNPTSFLNAVAASSWDSGHYGMHNGGANKLLGIYKTVAAHGMVQDNITPGPVGDISVGHAAVAVDETFNPARVFTVHKGSTVTGYNQQGAVRTASWNRDSQAHTDQACTLTQTVDPEAVPHGKFYHVTDGVYAGLYVPQADVTLEAAGTPPVEPPVTTPPTEDCAPQVTEGVAANEAKWTAWLATAPVAPPAPTPAAESPAEVAPATDGTVDDVAPAAEVDTPEPPVDLNAAPEVDTPEPDQAADDAPADTVPAETDAPIAE